MKNKQAYPIGIPGKAWGEDEKKTWFKQQRIRRSYAREVLAKVEALKDSFTLEQYSDLSYSMGNYPLFAVKTPDWSEQKESILVSGGVHGYETSGVQGAIRFLETRAAHYATEFNLLLIPCVSPWAYETINRWNPAAIDPNRSFYPKSLAAEVAALMHYLSKQDIHFTAHIDLHETTDTDNSEFRPALAARDAVEHENWDIPDGFYLVGDTERPVADFQTAIIKSVEKITHIAPPDDDGRIIGETLQQHGVINYAARPLGLCMGLTDARYVTTTEVYPDSPLVNDEECINAQVAAVTGALEFIAVNAC